MPKEDSAGLPASLWAECADSLRSAPTSPAKAKANHEEKTSIVKVHEPGSMPNRKKRMMHSLTLVITKWAARRILRENMARL